MQQSIGSAAYNSCLGTGFGASKRALRGRGSHSNDSDFSENFFCACARQQRGTYRKLMLALVDGRSHFASEFQEARFPGFGQVSSVIISLTNVRWIPPVRPRRISTPPVWRQGGFPERMEQAVSLIHQAKSASGEQRDSLLERLLTLLRCLSLRPKISLCRAPATPPASLLPPLLQVERVAA